VAATQIRMKKFCISLFAFSCLPVFAVGQAAAGRTATQPAAAPPAATQPAAAQPAAEPAASSQAVVEEIIARVNNQIITRSEFARSKDQLKEEVKQQDPNNADKAYGEREKDILRDLIDQQLLLEKGKDLGITGDTDLIKELDQMRKDMKLDSLEALEKEAIKQGYSWEDFKQNKRNQIITQKVIGQEVSGRLALTKEEEEKFYEEHKSEMEQPEYIRLAEILVAPKETAPAADTADPSAAGAQPPVDAAAKQAADAAALSAAETKANDLLKQIRDGGNFEDIAKKNSDGPSAADGGTLGMFKRGQLAKELEDKTFAMKAGEVTDVIRTKQGYVILKVIDHQQAGIPPMKDVMPKIENAIFYQKMQPALRAYLTKLREEAYIKYTEGYVDSGRSANQTMPVETVSAKEPDAKKLSKKRHKKLGII
jgi:peptidyl-prolyl cis-trans isomerase SurA